MNTRAKTIQIFLPGGDPRGIRVAEITTRIVQVLEVPRSLLPEFLKMPESEQVALYVLFGGRLRRPQGFVRPSKEREFVRGYARCQNETAAARRGCNAHRR